LPSFATTTVGVVRLRVEDIGEIGVVDALIGSAYRQRQSLCVQQFL
jgi:hypothetical protein